MSLIKNLVKEPEKKKRKTGDAEPTSDSEEDKAPRPIIKSAIDLQRLKLEKLMKNPDKPIIIPETPKDRDYLQTVPTFVRNVMGSSAGAGSGEFHVYRHLRRKEYARQKTIQWKCLREQQDAEYQQKLEENRRLAEAKTEKKRAKRLKKKQRAKRQKDKPKQRNEQNIDDINESTDSESEADTAEQTDEQQREKKAESDAANQIDVQQKEDTTEQADEQQEQQKAETVQENLNKSKSDEQQAADNSKEENSASSQLSPSNTSESNKESADQEAGTQEADA